MAAPRSGSSLVSILPPAPHEPVQNNSIVLRLSEQSLDALRKLVRSGLLDKSGAGTGVELEIAEGGASTLHVPGTQQPFPLSSSSLSPPLEVLSHRAHLASAPLHLAAFAHTRYAVRQTAVSQSAKERLREGKEKEEREKRGRKIVQLDADPTRVGSKGKGKAAATASTSKILGSTISRSNSKSDLLHPPRASSSTASGSRQASRSPAPPLARDGAKPTGTPLRTRILQLLALGPLSFKQIVTKVRANESDVNQILSEVARPSPTSNLYRLSPRSFLQLEIFTWKQYSQLDKNTVIAACEAAFDELGLPRNAEERRMIDPDWKGGSPLKQSVSASSIKQRDASTDSRASDKKKQRRREASPRPAAQRTDSSDESDDDAASTARKRKSTDGHSSASSSKDKRRRTIAPDDMPSAASPAESSSSFKSKVKSREPPASSVTAAASAPTPPASIPSHLKPSTSDIASSRAGPPVTHGVPSPPIIKKTKPASSAKAKLKRNTTPEFTSSEDERPPAISKRRAVEHDSDDGGRTHETGSSHSRSPSPPMPPLDLPTSRTALRARFKDLWAQYAALNILLERERKESEDLVAGRRTTGAAADRPWEEIKRDARRRNELHRELEEIKRRLR